MRALEIATGQAINFEGPWQLTLPSPKLLGYGPLAVNFAADQPITSCADVIHIMHRVSTARQAATQLAQGHMPSVSGSGVPQKRKRDAKRTPTGLALPAQGAGVRQLEEQQGGHQAEQQQEQGMLQGTGLNASQVRVQQLRSLCGDCEGGLFDASQLSVRVFAARQA
eukprot:1158898-Pelagomonas_calceolata.AAC.6